MSQLTLSEYQKLAFRTAKTFDTLAMDLTHASLGMVTEAGEFTTEVKRLLIYEAPLTVAMGAHMIEELGDLLWYVALAATHLQIDLGDVAKMNIDKLRTRFPEKYSDAAAEARADKGGATARES